MEENKKKTIILSVIGVLLLVAAVVGVSFAMYTFSGSGTTENVIQTGTVSLEYTETNTIDLTNQYPMTDALGIEQTGTDATLEFSVVSHMSGSMTINYDLGIDSITPSQNLLASDIRFILLKEGQPLTLNNGSTPTIDTISGRASIAAPNSAKTGVSTYGLDGGTFTGDNQSYNYVLKAWIRNDYELPDQTVTNSDVYTCSIPEHETQQTCQDDGGTWSVTGVSHSNSTGEGSFTFKVKVVAVQA